VRERHDHTGYGFVKIVIVVANSFRDVHASLPASKRGFRPELTAVGKTNFCTFSLSREFASNINSADTLYSQVLPIHAASESCKLLVCLGALVLTMALRSQGPIGNAVHAAAIALSTEPHNKASVQASGCSMAQVPWAQKS